VLKRAETGAPVAEVIRRMGVSEQTFYRWKNVYGGLGIGELRRVTPADAGRKLSLSWMRNRGTVKPGTAAIVIEIFINRSDGVDLGAIPCGSGELEVRGRGRKRTAFGPDSSSPCSLAMPRAIWKGWDPQHQTTWPLGYQDCREISRD
jgi:putative transposase